MSLLDDSDNPNNSLSAPVTPLTKSENGVWEIDVILLLFYLITEFWF